MDSARQIDPATEIRGSILVTVPHMDDAILGCGALLALIERKQDVRLVYATDGRRLVGRPRRGYSDFDKVDINSVRKAETLAALSKLGYQSDQVTFLDLPEGRLNRDRGALETALRDLEPGRYDHFFTPFRLDKHKDHIALAETVIDIAREEGGKQIWEYFVYHKWRLIRGGDIRGHIRPRNLVRVVSDPGAAGLKREALGCFVSQTSNYYPWMKRPVLSSSLVEEYSRSPEFFLRGGPPLGDVLPNHIFYKVINGLEPRLKNLKERLRMISPFAG